MPLTEFVKSTANPIITTGAAGSWDGVDLANPDITIMSPADQVIKGGPWCINVSGFNGAGGTPANIWQMGLWFNPNADPATGTWTPHPGNPVYSPNAFENTIAANGSIIWHPGLAKYFYYYQADPSNVTKIYAASTPSLAANPIIWTRLNSGAPVINTVASTWESGQTFDPMVRLMADNNTIEVFYGADSGSLASRGIGRATTTDGVTFTKDPANPYFTVATSISANINNFGEPSAIRIGDSSTSLTGGSLYIGFDCSDTSGNRYRAVAYTSSKGKSWAYRARQLDKGVGWDSAQVFDGYYLVYNGRLYEFYAGSTLAGGAQNLNAQIGMATADLVDDVI